MILSGKDISLDLQSSLKEQVAHTFAGRKAYVAILFL
jgi:hypothetical protein